jgi:outer membrane protein OmpA-like peptidoglycan-associated protein
MGYLEKKINDIPVVGQLYRTTDKAAQGIGIDSRDEKKKRADARAAAVQQQVMAMQDAARRQQIDILSQAKAAADTQADLAMRQSIQDKVAAQQAAATPGEVDVSLAATPDQPASAVRAKRRKQFGFDSSGYTPGVSL